MRPRRRTPRGSRRTSAARCRRRGAGASPRSSCAPVETMSSITTGVWPFHAPSGAEIETSRSPRRVFSRITIRRAALLGDRGHPLHALGVGPDEHRVLDLGRDPARDRRRRARDRRRDRVDAVERVEAVEVRIDGDEPVDGARHEPREVRRGHALAAAGTGCPGACTRGTARPARPARRRGRARCRRGTRRAGSCRRCRLPTIATSLVERVAVDAHVELAVGELPELGDDHRRTRGGCRAARVIFAAGHRDEDGHRPMLPERARIRSVCGPAGGGLTQRASRRTRIAARARHGSRAPEHGVRARRTRLATAP